MDDPYKKLIDRYTHEMEARFSNHAINFRVAEAAECAECLQLLRKLSFDVSIVSALDVLPVTFDDERDGGDA